eukprot:Seg3992.5 transcript_id=Seg3992.5/GoldUCD/mRNA.D3Y31 product="hypothetical protein" protein_id=Seg3992.5/GoldUCD/D3Y31
MATAMQFDDSTQYNVDGLNSMQPVKYMRSSRHPKNRVKDEFFGINGGFYEGIDKIQFSNESTPSEFVQCESFDSFMLSQLRIDNADLSLMKNPNEDSIFITDIVSNVLEQVMEIDEEAEDKNLDQPTVSGDGSDWDWDYDFNYENIIGGCDDACCASQKNDFRCGKWKSPGHAWLEVSPQDVIVEFASDRPFLTNQYFCLTPPINHKKLATRKTQETLVRLDKSPGIDRFKVNYDRYVDTDRSMFINSVANAVNASEEAAAEQDVNTLNLDTLRSMVNNESYWSDDEHHFSNDNVFIETQAIPELMGQDDKQWQCSKLIHRVAWKKAIEAHVETYALFSEYVYGSRSRTAVIDIVRELIPEVADPQAYFVPVNLLRENIQEQLPCKVRDEFIDQWKMTWSSYKTHPMLRHVMFDDEDFKYTEPSVKAEVAPKKKKSTADPPYHIDVYPEENIFRANMLIFPYPRNDLKNAVLKYGVTTQFQNKFVVESSPPAPPAPAAAEYFEEEIIDEGDGILFAAAAVEFPAFDIPTPALPISEEGEEIQVDTGFGSVKVTLESSYTIGPSSSFLASREQHLNPCNGLSFSSKDDDIVAVSPGTCNDVGTAAFFPTNGSSVINWRQSQHSPCRQNFTGDVDNSEYANELASESIIS